MWSVMGEEGGSQNVHESPHGGGWGVDTGGRVKKSVHIVYGWPRNQRNLDSVVLKKKSSQVVAWYSPIQVLSILLTKP